MFDIACRESVAFGAALPMALQETYEILPLNPKLLKDPKSSYMLLGKVSGCYSILSKRNMVWVSLPYCKSYVVFRLIPCLSPNAEKVPLQVHHGLLHYHLSLRHPLGCPRSQKQVTRSIIW